MLNTELLNEIVKNQNIERKDRLEYQKEWDKRFLKLALDFSDFKNSQTKVNNKLSGYLETNTRTNQKGGIERIFDLEIRQERIEDKVNLTLGKATVGGTILIALGVAVGKILTLLF